MKTDNWNGHDIRFVEKDGEWWAVLKDVCGALGLSPKFVKQRLEKDVVSNNPLSTAGGKQEMLVINEEGIYETIFNSRKKEAKAFKKWVFQVIKKLRQETGLEGFQIFRLLDKEHQKEAMSRLSRGLASPVRIDFIKANTIANKVVSNKHGHQKMLKKGEMTPAMLVDREGILDNTVELMTVRDKYGLDISVSEALNRKN